MNVGSDKDIRILERVCSAIEKKFDYLLELDSEHNRRAATVFSFSGVILSIVFYIYLTTNPFVVLFFIGVGVIFVSLILSLYAIKSWKLILEPKPQELIDDCMSFDYRQILLWLISRFKGGYKYNKRIIMIRGVIIDFALVLIVIGLGFIGVSVFI